MRIGNKTDEMIKYSLLEELEILKHFWSRIVELGKHRRFWLAAVSFLAISVVLMLAFAPVLGAGKTKLIVSYGGQKYNFFTSEKTLGAALLKKGIAIFPQDRSGLSLQTPLTGSPLTVNIVKSEPVLILDGYQKVIGRTTQTEPAKILADNNIKTWPEDKLTLGLNLDPVSTGTAGLVVRVSRAPVYYVQVDGGQKEVRSWDSKVSNILAASQVQINKIDEISPPSDAKLVPGTAVVVTRINEEDVDEASEIPYETKNNTSTAVAFGQSSVTQTGVNGTIKKIYHIVYKNGVMVSKTLSSSIITKASQTKIITRGIKVGRANFGYYDGMTTSFYMGMTGHHLLVTNLANGKQVTVTIIGSGPFNGPLMDMGTAAFQAIGGTLSSGYIPSVSVALLD